MQSLASPGLRRLALSVFALYRDRAQPLRPHEGVPSCSVNALSMSESRDGANGPPTRSRGIHCFGHRRGCRSLLWPPQRLVALALAFASGALITALTFVLLEEAIGAGRPWIAGSGLLAGALRGLFGFRLAGRRNPRWRTREPRLGRRPDRESPVGHLRVPGGDARRYTDKAVPWSPSPRPPASGSPF